MIAFIFPAFTHDYKNHPGSELPGFHDSFNSLLNKASIEFEPRVKHFNFQDNTFLDDELLSQYITYIYSCASAEALRKTSVIPDIAAGYSMGIYAALADAGSISFIDGLRLIEQAFLSIATKTSGTRFAMGTVIGLDLHDLLKIIHAAGNSLEITNQNSTHSFVLSGICKEIEIALALASEEGALHTKLLKVTVPYHSRFLEEAAYAFLAFVKEIPIEPASTHLISLIDQQWFSSPGEIVWELTRNLYFHLNWYKTQQYLLGIGIKSFIECGPSKGLVKNAKFIEGNYTFSSLDSLVV